jgi:hypothetical protein
MEYAENVAALAGVLAQSTRLAHLDLLLTSTSKMTSVMKEHGDWQECWRSAQLWFTSISDGTGMELTQWSELASAFSTEIEARFLSSFDVGIH